MMSNNYKLSEISLIVISCITCLEVCLLLITAGVEVAISPGDAGSDAARTLISTLAMIKGMLP